MAHILTDAALGAAPLATHCAFDARARALLTAVTSLLPLLEIGRPVESACLREAMTAAFGGTDAEGAWDWKSAYDACEVAQILFLRRFGPAILSRGGPRSRSLALIERVSALLPTHTRRSETSQALQQYSTPAGLSFVAVVAASIGAGETVLEPSAGTGMLAIQAELAGAQLVLNELAEGRAALLSRLFSSVAVSGHDAASIDDRLPTSARPSVILMNPPFSAVAHVDRTMKDAALPGPSFGAIGDGPRPARRNDMATIANLTVKSDDSFEGNLATLTVSAPIAIIPNNRKTKDSEPDYRIVSRKNGFELGAGWKRFSQNTGAEYVSVSLSAPEFGTIYGNIANAPGDDPSKKVIIWNPPS